MEGWRGGGVEHDSGLFFGAEHDAPCDTITLGVLSFTGGHWHICNQSDLERCFGPF